MDKNNKILLCITLGLCAILVVVAALYMRTPIYEIQVEQSFFAVLSDYASKEASDFPKNFKIVQEGFSPEVNFFSRTRIPIVAISKKKSAQSAEQLQAEYPERLYFTLNKTFLAPVAKTAEYGTIAPTTTELLPVDKIPKGYLALPFGNKTIADDDYPLVEHTHAEILFLDRAKAEQIKSWLTRFFLDEGNPLCQNPDDTKPALVAAVGDMMLSRGVEDILIEAKDGIEQIFTTTLPILQANHITIGNLEGCVTQSNDALLKTYNFKFKKEMLSALKRSGFTYLALANNHAYDYGAQGFSDTLEALQQAGIATSGAGKNYAEAAQFWRTTVNGQKISILSCGYFPMEQCRFDGKTTATATDSRPGMLWGNEQTLNLIREEKKQNTFIIIYIHAGNEYERTANASQQEFFHALCDAGADAVFGSHPHVLQAHEWYNSSLIVYSLGNFIFPGMDDMPGATDSQIVQVAIYNNRILYYTVHSTKIKGKTVELLRKR